MEQDLAAGARQRVAGVGRDRVARLRAALTQKRFELGIHERDLLRESVRSELIGPEIRRETGMTERHRNRYCKYRNGGGTNVSVPWPPRRMSQHDHQHCYGKQERRCNAQKIHWMTARHEIARERPYAAPYAGGNDKPEIAPVVDEELHNDG